jgi:hypothetical protein
MAKEQGRPWRPEELEVIDRYLALVAARRYRSARRAAEPCWRELRRRKLGDRTLGAVHIRMILRARERNLRWPGVHWSESEKRVLRRHARALLHGGRRTASSAVLACQRDLRKLPLFDRAGIQQRPPDGRSQMTVCDHLRKMAHTLGWSQQRRNWDAWESGVLRRYAGALIEGRFRDAPSAARACERELERLASKRHNGEQAPPRAFGAIMPRLRDLVTRTGLARSGSRLTRTELRTVERYARAVGRGEYGHWSDAARACVAELNRKVSAAAVGNPLRVRKVKGHSVFTIHGRILDVAHGLKLPGPRRILWTDAEKRVCADWTKWYNRRRTALRRRGVWKETVFGMQEQLEAAGFRRSLAACDYKLRKMRMRAQGAA